MAKDTDLGTGSVGRLLLKLALPAIAAQLINLLYNLVDRMYIGHIPVVGATALTGVGVTMPVLMVISAFAALVSMGGAPRAAIHMGARDNTTAEKIMGNCLTALVVIAVILTAVCLIWCEPLLLLFGASPDTVGYGVEYLRIYACGTLFVQLALGMNAFITTQGFATTSMFTVLIGAVLNILLDPLFIFVFQMGVQGAALATILSQCVSALWVIRFLMGKRTILRLKRKYLIPEPRTLFPCLALGIAPFIMQSTESLIAVCFNTSLLKYGGDTAVGAMTILTSVMQFSMLPLMGLSQGAQPIVSYNYGAKDLGRVKKAFLYLLLFSMIFTTVLWSAVMLFPQAFASMFTSDAALMPMTVWAMRIYMAASLLFGVQISCQQTFIALGNAKTSMFLALLRKIILLIPLIYLLPNFFDDKLFAVFLSEPIADTLAVLVTATMFFFTFRKLEKSVQPPGAAG